MPIGFSFDALQCNNYQKSCLAAVSLQQYLPIQKYTNPKPTLS